MGVSGWGVSSTVVTTIGVTAEAETLDDTSTVVTTMGVTKIGVTTMGVIVPSAPTTAVADGCPGVRAEVAAKDGRGCSTVVGSSTTGVMAGEVVVAGRSDVVARAAGNGVNVAAVALAMLATSAAVGEGAWMIRTGVVAVGDGVAGTGVVAWAMAAVSDKPVTCGAGPANDEGAKRSRKRG